MAQMVGVEKVVTSIDYPILVQGSIPPHPAPSPPPPSKHQFSGGIEMEHWTKMRENKIIKNMKIAYLNFFP